MEKRGRDGPASDTERFGGVILRVSETIDEREDMPFAIGESSYRGRNVEPEVWIGRGVHGVFG